MACVIMNTLKISTFSFVFHSAFLLKVVIVVTPNLKGEKNEQKLSSGDLYRHIYQSCLTQLIVLPLFSVY